MPEIGRRQHKQKFASVKSKVARLQQKWHLSQKQKRATCVVFGRGLASSPARPEKRRRNQDGLTSAFISAKRRVPLDTDRTRDLVLQYDEQAINEQKKR